MEDTRNALAAIGTLAVVGGCLWLVWGNEPNVKKVWPAPIDERIYKGNEGLTIAEFKTSRGDFCVTVAKVGVWCQPKSSLNK